MCIRDRRKRGEQAGTDPDVIYRKGMLHNVAKKYNISLTNLAFHHDDPPPIAPIIEGKIAISVDIL